MARFATLLGCCVVLAASSPAQDKAGKIANDQLTPGKSLKAGQFLQSRGGKYRLLLRADGNLALQLVASRKTLWTSGLARSRAARLELQDDGNLALLTAGGMVVWEAKTGGHPSAVLRMQDDGDVVVADGDRRLWATDTFEPDPITNHFPKKVFQKLPVLNQRLLTYANAQHRRQVKDGDCWQFVDAARNAAGARRGSDAYVWGAVTTAAQAVPGDIIQMRSFKSKTYSTSDHHTAILWKKHDDNVIEVIHANSPPNGKRVGRLKIQLDGVTGSIVFYRPVP